MRECEVRGRPIKTGRKYCWEHRNPTESDREYGLLNKAEKVYVRYRENQLSPLVFLIVFLTIPLCFLFIFKGEPFDLILIKTLFICMGVWLFTKIIIISKAKREKNLRTKKYTDFLSDVVKSHRDNRDFKKSILRQ